MSTSNFLASIQDEKVTFFPRVPESVGGGGQYLKVSKIGNGLSNPLKLRLLGAFTDGTMIEGYRAFLPSGKPIRRKTIEEIPLNELGTNAFGQQEKPVLFWAFPVFVFDETNVQICEIHQVGLMRELERLGSNSNWGDPRLYNIEIMKTGAGNKTAYQVTPKRDSFPEEFLEVASQGANSIDLSKLFVNEDPFINSTNSEQSQ